MIESPLAGRPVLHASAGSQRLRRWQRLLRNRALVVGSGLSAAVVVMALLAPCLAPYDPLAIHPDHTLGSPPTRSCSGRTISAATT